MRKIIFVIFAFFSFAANGAEKAIKVCYQELDGCLIETVDEFSRTEIYVSENIHETMPEGLQSEFNSVNVRIIRMNAALEAKLQPRVSVADEETLEETREAIEDLSTQTLKDGGACAFSLLACGGASVAYLKNPNALTMFGLRVGCAKAAWDCVWTKEKFRMWRELKDEYEKEIERQKKESEGKNDPDAEALRDGPKDVESPFLGPAFMPMIGGGSSGKIPQGEVIIEEAPPGPM